MSEPLTMIAEVVPASPTERTVLDALHRRLCARANMGNRYALAEHVRLDPAWARRIIDAVAVDTWRSAGFGLHGFEVKVSRSDLRREILQPEKSGAFMEHLDTFTIVAPPNVLNGWRDMAMPETWGVAALEGGGFRYLRKPADKGWEGANRNLPLQVVASLSRAIAATAARHCVRMGCDR